jgi:hypothetical protein
MKRSNTTVRRRKQKRKKERSSFYIGMIGFMIITIYLFGYVYKFVNKQTVPIEVVQYGTIKVPQVYNGIIIRNEYLARASSEGKMTYYYSDGDKISKNAIVCDIRNTKESTVLEEEIKKYDAEIAKIQENRTDISLFQDDINRINNKITQITNNYIASSDANTLNNLYTFKDKLKGEIALRNQILLTENKGSISSLVEGKFIQEEQLKKAINGISAPESGIVSFCLDGYEERFKLDHMASLTPEETNMKISVPERLDSTEIKKDTPIFKIVNSTQWYIASYIPDEISKGWVVGDLKTLTVDNDTNDKIEVNINNIIQGNGQKLIIFSTTRNMSNYINTRSIRFEVEAKAYKGLKIPNSAIVEKTFLKIPMEYVVEQSGQYNIIKSQDVAGILIPIKISFTDEDNNCAYILQDFNSVKLGDKIIKPNDKNSTEYAITEVTTQLGVYIVNSGIAELKTIEVIGNNETYAILNPDKVYGVKIYDRIISDSKNILENQTIY